MLRITLTAWVCSLLLATQNGNAQPSSKNKDGKTFTSNKSALDMRGAYQLTRQVANDGTKDSVMNARQLKIFTDQHMLYVHPGPDDSLAVYGVGRYSVENGKVIEQVFYTSDAGPINERYTLDISQSGDTYSQVIQFPAQENNVSWKLTEDYKRVDQKMTTPLDGAWKLVRTISEAKDGTTKTNESPTQFKFYYRGNFAWVHTTKDSASQKPVSFYGYGNFKMNGNNEIVENNTSSSFKSVLVNKPVTVQIKMLDKDRFSQTINWDGAKETEVYERMK